MSTNFSVAKKSESSAAIQLAELSLVEVDLRHVQECAWARLELDYRGPHSWTFVRSLATSALVAYRRCFSGVRAHLLHSEIESVVPDHYQSHRFFVDLASKAYAHTEWSPDTGVAGITVGTSEDGTKKFGGVSFQGELNFDLSDRFPAFANLSETVRSLVLKPKMDLLRSSVRAWAEELDPSDVAAGPDAWEQAAVDNRTTPRQRLRARK